MQQLHIKDSFNKELPADPVLSNTRRQVSHACYSFVTPKVPSAPQLIHVSESMLEAIGLKSADADSKEFLEVFSGAKVIEDTHPYAMCYGGHQFGHWAGQLGDGRAINLCEVVHNDHRWALQLKGAGETPYSRTADGLAVLRSSIREHLCSEAMHYLGVPTTRSLSLMLTGAQVLRDMMYDGNGAYEKGAIVCRAAPSFIRFGNFQILAAKGDVATLKALTDYTIKYFFPEIKTQGKEAYIQFFKRVTDLSLEMVVHWQRVGFVHGVMNTDNMSILGLTIDYGPYGWLEGYDHGWTPNTTDRAQKRYRYGYQPHIVLWNLAQLANSIVLLVEDDKPFHEIIDQYKVDYHHAYQKMMKSKLGLYENDPHDKALIGKLEELLKGAETDMTIFFRELASVQKESNFTQTVEQFEPLQKALYHPDQLDAKLKLFWVDWFNEYIRRLQKETTSEQVRSSRMNRVNPKYVLRNYMAQLAIDKAELGDYSLIDDLHEMLKKPYDDQAQYEEWYAKRPEWARHKVGCSMLSCSS